MALDPLEYWQRPRQSRPWVLGHRGLCTDSPENTLGAFEAALRAGADGVELDVRLSRDAEVVVVHDRTLTRITLGTRTEPVAELTWAQLAAVTLPSSSAEVGSKTQPNAERLSTLAEVLAWADHRQCRVNVELKHEGDDPTRLVRAVADVVGSSEHPERLLFSSFDKTTVCELARTLGVGSTQAPYVIAWLTEHGADHEPTLAELSEHAIRAIHPKHVVLTADVMRTLRQRFALINAWTVNQPQSVIRLASLGIDSIITDDPRAALRALAEARP